MHGPLALGSGYTTPHGSGAVLALQRRLAWAGFSPGPLDGRFGPLTERAVMRLQAADGLVADGVAGPLTRSALAAPVLHPGAGYGLSGGSGAVRALQRRLARAGYAPGPVDGRFGQLTGRAVMRLQVADGLAVDGVAGPQTDQAIKLAYQRTSGQSAQAATKPVPRINSAPETQPKPGPGPQRVPSLPVSLVLLALAGLGLATIALSYVRTKARIRQQARSQAGPVGPSPLQPVPRTPRSLLARGGQR